VALVLSESNDIPAMHKVAVCPVAQGERVRKYNQTIGLASQPISAGEHVHVHNCEFGGHDVNYRVGESARPTEFVAASERATFQGFHRENGTVGTRNFVGILTSVNCSATVARQIASVAESSGLMQDFPNVDGVVALTHGSGCGMQSAGEGFESLRRVIDGYAGHPNFAGVLMVGLGCETMQTDVFRSSSTGGEFRTLGIQDSGGTRKAIDAGLEIVRELLQHANRYEREQASVQELTIALQCGGSDAYSGITANPALGIASDLVISNGGTAILSETPEIYGAEHLLIERAASPEVAQQLIERVQWWREYAQQDGASLDSNPSPGNKKGGLTTILEKSLGAQAKSGSTNLNAVTAYAERSSSKGLVFMDGPGFDPASVTGQVAAGANVVCFTTGRGSAFGFKPAPSVKLATNSTLFENMSDDMDLNCGTIVDGSETVEECGQRIFEMILRVASGEPSKSELLGYGDNEFTPWQIGAVY